VARATCDARVVAPSMWANTGLARGRASAAAEARGFMAMTPDAALTSVLGAFTLAGERWVAVGVDDGRPYAARHALGPPVVLEGREASEGGERGRGATSGGRLAAIWRALLDLEEVSPEDNFFDLGGHSLLVPRLLDEVKAAFGVTLPAVDVFRYPTLRELTDRVESAAAGRAREVVAAVWCELLDLPAVEGAANFFELGGHSLLVPGLQERLRERLGVSVEAVAIFRNPTLDAFVAYVEAKGGGAPRVEERLAAIWRQVLDLERVDPEDNFFDLGGHSLVVPKIQELVRVEFGITVPAVEFFRHPTLQAFASQVLRAAPAAADRPIANRDDGMDRLSKLRSLRQRSRPGSSE
jgi:acyl carrier protein